MSSKSGIWLDHRKAVIVHLTEGSETITTIESNVEKHPERGGDSPLKGPYEALQVPADDSRQRALTGELNIYYDAVIAALPHQATVVIFGPGEAKVELRKRLAKIKPDVRVSATETEDKMTDRQIIAKVRAHFGLGSPRLQPPK